MERPRFSGSVDCDPFFQLVQQDLVEPLGLENVVISVDRHSGTNCKFGVMFSIVPAAAGAKSNGHHDPVITRKQLTVNQLAKEIQVILDELLEGCVMQFGDITFVVKNGVLKKTVFSFDTRPSESSAIFFVVTI